MTLRHVSEYMAEIGDATTMRAREESHALAHLTDAQALATWERMKAVRKAYVAAVLSEIAE